MAARGFKVVMFWVESDNAGHAKVSATYPKIVSSYYY